MNYPPLTTFNYGWDTLDFLEIFSLIRFGESLYAVVRTNDRGLHPLQPECFPNPSETFAPGLL